MSCGGSRGKALTLITANSHARLFKLLRIDTKQAMQSIEAKRFAASTTATRCAPALYSRLMVEGAATTPAVDFHNQILVPAGCQVDALPVPLKWAHDQQIGEVCWVRKTPGVVFVRATIDENQHSIWAAIKAGELHRMSVDVEALTPLKPDENGVMVCESWRLKEVSLTFNPANPECACWVWKAPQFQPITLLQSR